MRCRYAALILLGIVTAGCRGGATEPSPPEKVTEPSPPNVTETFTGTITGDPGSDEQFFTVEHAGEYSVTLNSFTPLLADEHVVWIQVRAVLPDFPGECGPNKVGEIMVLWNGSRVLPVLMGPINPGPYCVLIADFDDRFFGDEHYSLTVSHP